MRKLKDMPTEEIFAALIHEGFDYVRNSRRCPELPDEEFALINVQRVLMEKSSGRSFLQYLDQVAETPKKRATYFDALNSSRRAEVIGTLATGLEKILERKLESKGVDYLSQFPELAGRYVFAADGHSICHASHSQKSRTGRHIASESVFMLDLRLGLMRSMAPVSGPAKKGHDWNALKRVLPEFRRQLGKQKKAPILIYDRACPDLHFLSEQLLLSPAV